MLLVSMMYVFFFLPRKIVTRMVGTRSVGVRRKVLQVNYFDGDKKKKIEEKNEIKHRSHTLRTSREDPDTDFPKNKLQNKASDSLQTLRFGRRVHSE